MMYLDKDKINECVKTCFDKDKIQKKKSKINRIRIKQ